MVVEVEVRVEVEEHLCGGEGGVVHREAGGELLRREGEEGGGGVRRQLGGVLGATANSKSLLTFYKTPF